MEKPLLYQTHDIMFQECPGETSLGIMVAGCEHYCKGCHSPNLWKYEGKKLLDDIDNLLLFEPYITCVIFMGGDQNPEELITCLKKVEELGLKTCLYSGCELDQIPFEILTHLNYVKVGSYKEKLGGLKSNSTNQKFYKTSKSEYEKGLSGFFFEEIKFYKGEHTMNFGQALQKLKEGKKIARQGWNGKNQYIELAKNISYINSKNEVINGQHEAMGNSAIAFVGNSGVQIGWLASQADILANDWTFASEIGGNHENKSK